MTKENFNLGRFRVDGHVLIGRPDGDYIEVVCEGDELPRALAGEVRASSSSRRVPVAAATMLPPLRPDRAGLRHRHQLPTPTEPKRKPLRPSAHSSSTRRRPILSPMARILNPNKKITSKLDYEGEIAVVIGQTCKDASVDTALSFVAGVCALNDGSARDLGKVALGKSGPGATYWPDWTAGKGLDGASALGPTISCGPEVLGALRDRTLTITTRLNGEVVQNGSMKEMIFSTEQIIATLSSYMTLLPGDVIATGTPAGVGMARNRFLETGDALEIQVGGLEALCVKVG